MDKRCDFELFKSNVCHELKRLGDIDFLIETLENDEISYYYKNQWYPECLYLLAMLDYISRINDVPLCDKYNQIRKCKLKETIYPSSIIALSLVSHNENIKEEAQQNSIPEFINFNIVENEIRNII